MSHTCPDCGLEHGTDVVEVPAEVDLAPVADASVEIARIEADRDVEVAKIEAKVEVGWQEQRIAELEGKLAGMQEMLGRLAPPEPEPDPEPAAVIVDPPAPEPIAPEPAAAPPPITEPGPTAKSKSKSPWW